MSVYAYGFDISESAGSWGGRLSGVQDSEGEPRSAAGTFGATFATDDQASGRLRGDVRGLGAVVARHRMTRARPDPEAGTRQSGKAARAGSLPLRGVLLYLPWSRGASTGIGTSNPHALQTCTRSSASTASVAL